MITQCLLLAAQWPSLRHASIRTVHRNLLLNQTAIDDNDCLARVTAKTFLGGILTALNEEQAKTCSDYTAIAKASQAVLMFGILASEAERRVGDEWTNPERSGERAGERAGQFRSEEPQRRP